jgi:hypothetical protein
MIYERAMLALHGMGVLEFRVDWRFGNHDRPIWDGTTRRDEHLETLGNHLYSRIDPL